MLKRVHLHLLVNLLKTTFLFAPMHFSITLGLMLVRSITSGIGLLLIIPLLQLIGISMGGDKTNAFAAHLQVALQTINLPLNLFSVLFCYSLIIILVALVSFAEEINSAILQEKYTQHLRLQVNQELLFTSWPFFIQKNIADSLHSLTAQVQATSLCQVQLMTLINKVLLVVVYTVVAIFVSWQMTLAAIACALILLSLMLPLHRLTSKSGVKLVKRHQTIFQSFYEQLAGLKMIKGSHGESSFIEKTRLISTALTGQTRHLTTVMAASKLMYACGSVVCFSLLLYAAINWILLPIVALLMLLIVFTRLLPMMASLQQSYQVMLRHLPFYGSLIELRNDCLAHQEEHGLTDEPDITFQHAIVFDKVSFSYQPDVLPMIIQQLSLQLKKNTTTALIGPSGSGKTTLADLIVGLLEPTKGFIYIDEQQLDHSNRHSWRKSLAYVPQNSFLFNTSIRENLQLFSNNVSDDFLWDVLKKVSADEFIAKLEHGLDTTIGDRGVRLSGGEIQRIALARALLMKPALLILDESTNSLDPKNIHHIQQALFRLHGETTILIISHQLEMSKIADQVIRLGSECLTEYVM